ncbi:hypothetical protein A2Y99_00295 [Candidatus Gottesmanbacteria bacterium RBG_13_37_7]|uniref:Uncharacterized protein n=1 Tax=Candidatus Gottesmanbacteria bacterium RBG_13_37_7 TaxID=1798369 RepID=A0A1F5YHL4_9BACT|nr:MAG: hypothetical protein A2Y99_00295 [Candidatus Gottesmanbacteria bacterium RBG_13_37_7]
MIALSVFNQIRVASAHRQLIETILEKMDGLFGNQIKDIQAIITVKTLSVLRVSSQRNLTV